jgi:hypothetical protein
VVWQDGCLRYYFRLYRLHHVVWQDGCLRYYFRRYRPHHVVWQDGRLRYYFRLYFTSYFSNFYSVKDPSVIGQCHMISQLSLTCLAIFTFLSNSKKFNCYIEYFRPSLMLSLSLPLTSKNC